ncbi:Carrier domain-containing protein OS=Lysinibacillus sphaericus OX=1421 GN=LS41612_16120 PE=3 SV=1 [Lysinibacillus sphaericus]
MMISILGVLKAGGAYLPIDKTYPKDRVDFMLQDTKTQWVLCQKDVENTLRENNVSIITLDDSEIYKQETSNPNYNITGKTLAYIIYTSGTTGKPKGILTTHLNVIRIAKENLYLDINENDCILQLSNVVFDGSIFDIFGSLLNGSKLVLPSTELTVNEISKIIEDEKVSICFITTALFNTFIENQRSLKALSKMKQILFGGETASLAHVKKGVEELGAERITHVYGHYRRNRFCNLLSFNRLGSW